MVISAVANHLQRQSWPSSTLSLLYMHPVLPTKWWSLFFSPSIQGEIEGLISFLTKVCCRSAARFILHLAFQKTWQLPLHLRENQPSCKKSNYPEIISPWGIKLAMCRAHHGEELKNLGNSMMWGSVLLREIVPQPLNPSQLRLQNAWISIPQNCE